LDSKFTLKDDDFIVMSEFFEHCHTAFRSMPFLKNLDIWSIVILIYKNQLLSLPCSYKFLETSCHKSEVFLYRTLRDGLDAGFLEVVKGTSDKRKRYYTVTDLGISYLEKLKHFGK